MKTEHWGFSFIVKILGRQDRADGRQSRYQE
jgi:hypothetical protein